MTHAGYLCGLSALFLLLGVDAAGSQTLVQKQTMALEGPKLTEQAETASRSCSTPITAGFDWVSFVAADKIEDANGAFHNPPSNMCSVPLRAWQSLCQDAVAKQSVAGKIKSYECSYQEGATPALSLDLDGKLHYRSSFEAYHNPPTSTPVDFVKDWLGKHL